MQEKRKYFNQYRWNWYNREWTSIYWSFRYQPSTKKLCFTLLALAKLYSTVHYIKHGEHSTEHYYGGNNKRYKELIDTSHTSLTANKLHQNIGELATKDIVEIRNKGFIKLSFIYGIEPGGETAIKIRSFDSIGLYYDLHTGQKKVKSCVNCQTPFRFKSNKSKYCPSCASDIAKEKQGQE